MKAKDLINQLTNVAKKNKISLDDLEVSYRENYESDVKEMNWVMEDLYDSETNSVLQSVVLMEDGNTYDEDEDGI